MAPRGQQYQERPHTPPPPGARTLIFQFEVEDSGPGIPEQLKDRVFEPFVQGDLGLSKKFGGTGLGYVEFYLHVVYTGQARLRTYLDIETPPDLSKLIANTLIG